MANGATEDPSEHVSTAIRTRRGAVGKRGYQAACMIGDDAIGDVDRVFQRPAIGAGAADVGDSVKDPREEIGVVVASAVLKDRHQTLESHAGIDVSRGEGV